MGWRKEIAGRAASALDWVARLNLLADIGTKAAISWSAGLAAVTALWSYVANVPDPYIFISGLFVFGLMLWSINQIKAISSTSRFSDVAELKLQFDASINAAHPSSLLGVEYYFFHPTFIHYHDKDTGQLKEMFGHVIIFMAFSRPTHTNFYSVKVVGENKAGHDLVDRNQVGAVVRFNTDLRGRAIEIKFSKEPIPL